MKKILSVVIAIIMVAAMSATAFAATAWDPDPGQNDDVANGSKEVPMYGYVGPVVTNPTDPDPDDPGTNPWTALNMSVPVKFIWAAFDDGTNAPTASVESPTYNLINNSQRDVKVTVTDFDDTNGLSAAEGVVSLNFTSTDFATTPLVNTITPAAPALLGTMDGIETAQATVPTATEGETWTFEVGGIYTPNGTWPTTLKTPEYKVTFNFALQ